MEPRRCGFESRLVHLAAVFGAYCGPIRCSKRADVDTTDLVQDRDAWFPKPRKEVKS